MVNYIECDNPSCNLRFPSYDHVNSPKRCPRCRSNVHVVLTVSSQAEPRKNDITCPRWKLEILLDNLRSAWNVGAILRTSDGLGIRKAYCCGITPTPDQSKVSKTALGAESTITWESHNNGARLAETLKSQGYALWALEDTPRAISLYSIEEIPNGMPLVLVLGNENCGIDPAILATSDQIISIPMSGQKQSYNVAVAFGIAASFLNYRHNFSQGSDRILPST